MERIATVSVGSVQAQQHVAQQWPALILSGLDRCRAGTRDAECAICPDAACVTGLAIAVSSSSGWLQDTARRLSRLQSVFERNVHGGQQSIGRSIQPSRCTEHYKPVRGSRAIWQWRT